jgi:hypothetical protein
MKWPGDANVAVSVVHVSKGTVAELALLPTLDGLRCQAINSRLRPGAERADPRPLAVNRDKSFVGTYVLGMGFVLSPDQRRGLIQSDGRNADRIFRYIGGEEINSDPDPRLERYVINFGQMDLRECERWPDLLEIVRRDVKPERDRVNRDAHRKYWWHFGDKRPALYEALAPLKRCLLNSQVSKHLVFAWRPATAIFGHTTYVYPVTEDRWLAVLQSRVHEGWARLLSSSLEDRLRYAPSDCFETFPFPASDAFSALDAIGARLDAERSAFMRAKSIGLTSTYNRLKDAANADPEILRLRKLHEELDRAVLAAYGWSDVAVPPFAGADPKVLERFEDDVIDRLFALNEERAKAEALKGGTPSGKKPRPKKQPVA